MNKNPFGPQTSYQPPLPPGPPPAQAAQPDYSAYWAAAAQQQQQQQQPHPQAPPSVGTYNQQWTAPQPPRPPAEQSALYANYGYGTQNNHWRQQQQQQQQQQPQQYHPPPPVAQPPPPPPPAQPGYNPYQPTAGYPQPYVPQAQPMAQPFPHQQPSQAPQQQQFFQHPPPQQHHLPQHPQQSQMQMQQPRNIHHTPPQHMPPAKRQRFDGPNNNQNHRAPPQPQFQAPTGPMQSGPYSGPGRGGGGGNQPGLGGGGRGEVEVEVVVVEEGGGGGGGGSMNGNRGGGMSGRGGRGGSYSTGGGQGGRGGGGGGSTGSVRGHGSRGNFGGNKDYHNRRGGGSFTGGGAGGNSGSFQSPSGSFRARGQNHSNSGRGRNDGSGTFGTHGAANSSFNSGKKDENRRTLTDFKIVGLEIRELSWTWGVLPSSPVKTEPTEVSLATDDSQASVKAEIPAEEGGAKAIVAPDASDTVASGSAVNATEVKAAPAPDIPVGPRVASDTGPPPSRMRIYFHTPVTAVDSHPIPHNASFLGATPSDSRKGKRKKIESDDGDFEEGRAPPPPPGMNDERSASIAPSVAETTSEGDWLMAAIGGEASHGPDGNDDAEDEFQIVDHRENDGAVDGGAETNIDGELLCYGTWLSCVDVPRLTGRGNVADGGVDNGSAAHDARPAGTGVSAVANGPSSSSDAVAAVAHVNGAPPEAVSASTASVSPLLSSGQTAVAPSKAADAASSAPGSTEQEQATNTPALESLPSQAAHSLLTLSSTATLLNIDHADVPASPAGTVQENDHDGEQTQTQDLEATQADEPPPSASGTRINPVKPQPKGPKVPAANRLSISYEGGNRRLIFDAEVVDSIVLFRREARVEVQVNLIQDGEAGLKGILMETLSEVTKSYLPIQSTADSQFPPFSQISTPLAVTLIVHLDTARPLSEPKWVKTGDIPEWLKSLFGRMFWFAGDAAESWEKKIVVSDPDPPPTLGTVLEGWTVSSSAGTPTERQRFLKTHLTETDNILEILLRLVRGDRSGAQPSQANTQTIAGPLLSALTPGSAHGAQQTPVSLAVFAGGSDSQKLGCNIQGVEIWESSRIAFFVSSSTVMFRNTYDSDNTVFSPQGRLHQVEYALEAVKQGSAAVGLRSKTHSILLALKRSTGELASYQQKMFRIDDHVGIAIAGLTSDARVLSNFMRQQAMSSKMIFNRPVPVNRLVSAIADKAQVNTQEYGRRPYGVGFLVIGQDQTGPHLYEFSPSGNSYEYYAMSIGARSQSAKTYLEKHYKSFEDCSLEELVQHGLHALRETLQQDKELNVNNTSIGIIGPAGADEKGVPPAGPFRILEGEKIDTFLKSMVPKELETSTPAAAAAPAAGAPAAPAADEDVQMEG
ncbi:hypothetical protein C8J57DRAFT_1432583 [Mycena rebaudengoi]|nr:hypothetical protein C8J57DRAFT_1432583 [Mycena rebaudengoi]